MSFLFVTSLSWRITKKRFLLDLHKGFCSARSAVVNAAERHCPLVAKLHIVHVVMLGVENSSFLFDSQPKAWRSEKGPSDTCTNDHHAQWKNWHMSDRAQESGECGRVNAFLLLILIVVKLMLSSTCQHFIKDTFPHFPSWMNSAQLTDLFSIFMEEKQHRGQFAMVKFHFQRRSGCEY